MGDEMGERRPPYGLAALASGLAFTLYLLTLAPTTAFWDTSEYIATAHILGIPHPPGNPLFVVLGKAWSLLLAPLGLSVAVRINLLAAATSALAAGFVYLIAHRILSAGDGGDRMARLGAAASALLGATAFTVWNQSNVNEKVYTVSVLIIMAVSWLTIRWYDRRHIEGSERNLLWAVALVALGATNHLMSVLPAPAIALVLLLAGNRRLLAPAFLGRAALLAALGLSFNFVLPIRASLDPVINEGDPECPSFGGAAVAIYTNGAAGCPMLADNLARRQYQTPPASDRQSPFSAQMEMWWQYFDWQWSRGMDASELPGTSRTLFSLLFLGLGGAGLWATWKADRTLFAYLFVLTTTLTVGLVVYLNFKYGFSLSPEVVDRARHEVRERDYFFIAGFLLWGGLAGIGLGWVWQVLSRLGGGGRALAAAPLLLVATVPLILNWSWASREGDYAARDWAHALLASVEPYGILFTNGDNDTFPLWYLQEVEGIRRDVTVIVGQYLHTSWYPKQLKTLTAPGNQRPFDPAFGGGLYRERTAPSDPVVSLDDEQLDGVGNARLDQQLTIPFPEVAVVYPTDTFLHRGHQLALSIIYDSIDERPIYFSAQGGLMSELGLDRWGVRQGLVTKLVLRDLAAAAPAGVAQGSPEYGAVWFDVGRSLSLYQDVYQYRGIRDRPIWQDRATLNIPWQYYALAIQLSDVVSVSGGEAALVDRLASDAAGFQMVAEGGARGTPTPPS